MPPPPLIVRLVLREGATLADLDPVVAASARALRAASLAARVWHRSSRPAAGPGVEVWLRPPGEARVTAERARAAVVAAVGRGAPLERVEAGGPEDAREVGQEIEFYGGPRAFDAASAGLAAISAAALAFLAPPPAGGACTDVEAAALLMDRAVRALGLGARARARVFLDAAGRVAERNGIDLAAVRPALDVRAGEIATAIGSLVGPGAAPDLAARAGGERGGRILARFRRALRRAAGALRAARRVTPPARPISFYAFRFVHISALRLHLDPGVEIALEHALGRLLDLRPSRR